MLEELDITINMLKLSKNNHAFFRSTGGEYWRNWTSPSACSSLARTTTPSFALPVANELSLS
jgi:hypothetical protein